MKLHRFIGNFNLKPGSELKLRDPELLNQMRSVLKLKISEKIILCDGQGNEGTAEITEYRGDFVGVRILDTGINRNEPERRVILYCAVLKKENFELVVQKATEVGITEIVPVITERTIKLNIRQDRLEKIAKEAAEQSGRGIIPILSTPVNFEDVIKATDKKDRNLLFDISGSKLLLADSHPPLTTIWIGPEGGWTVHELEIAKNSGFNIVSLGKTTLRAETAAIVASYISTI